MRVAVDAELCTGHGRCYVLVPDLFGPDDYGHCEILAGDGVVPDGLEDHARIGRENCPEQAITIEE
jgi:Ferredoxin